MASTIKLKNGSGAPLAGDLVQGEPALDLTNKRLYTEDSGGNVIEVGVNPTSITTGTITASGEITANGGIALGDNDKATFGSSDDLQIYHDGNHSYVEDTNAGNLYLKSNGAEITLRDGSNTSMIRAFTGGGVRLYNNGTERLEVTSTGIDVTGTVTADGLTVEGNAQLSASLPYLDFMETDTTDVNARVLNEAGTFRIASLNDAKTAAPLRFKIDHATGDLSLYEDTGTTPKFFWDASAESLGIGTTSPSSALDVNGQLSSATAGTATIGYTFGGQATKTGMGCPADGTLSFYAGTSTERMRIDSSGNVGIGTTSPTSTLQITNNTGNSSAKVAALSGTSATLEVSSDTYNQIVASGGGVLGINVSGSERMRIDSSGNVGIGVTSPTYKLQAAKASTGTGNQIAITSAGAAGSSATPNNMDLDFLGYANSVRARIRAVDQSSSTANSFLSFSVADPLAEAMRIDSSGNLLVGGTSSSSVPSLDKGVYLQSQTEGDVVGYSLYSNEGTNNRRVSFFLDDTNGVYGFDSSASSSIAPFVVKSAGSEQLRIDNSGNLLVSTTNTSVGVGNTNTGVCIGRSGYSAQSRDGAPSLFLNRNSSDGIIALFYREGLNVGNISVTSSTTTYNITSDQRLKDNIVDAPSSSDDIDAIQVRSFDWKADGSHQKYGMVAQELMTVAPEAVSGDPDSDEMMGVDYSKLVPMLIKEIQSLRARVAQLEN